MGQGTGHLAKPARPGTALESAQRPISIVYALTKPGTRDVRYVGCTTNLKRRYAEHLRDITGQDAKAEWMRGLRERGLKPGLIILEMVNIEAGAQIEAMWISMFRHDSTGTKLVNTGWCWPKCPKCRQEYNRAMGRAYFNAVMAVAKRHGV